MGSKLNGCNGCCGCMRIQRGLQWRAAEIVDAIEPPFANWPPEGSSLVRTPNPRQSERRTHRH